MPRGLGRIQRAIMNVLQPKNLHAEELAALTACALHPERFVYRGEAYFDRPPNPPGYACSSAEIASVRRAARRLERRGLVTLRGRPGPRGHRPVVSLAVDGGDGRLRA